MARFQPDIGDWYENIDTGELFEVVAVDESHQTIEVQYQDGALGEFEFDQWQELPVVSAAPPENANVAFGTAALEQDPGTAQMSEWDNPLDSVEGETFTGTDEPHY